MTGGMLDVCLPDSARALLVVAHPDDEVIWCGGLLLRYPRVEWDVLCCSVPRRDPVRALKFREACVRLGATRSRVYPVAESATYDLLPLPPVDFAEYRTVVTHGETGEYGHLHHRSIHYGVVATAPQTMHLITMAARRRRRGELLDQVIELTAEEVARKVYALQAYDHFQRGRPKWVGLLGRYVREFGPLEAYDVVR